MSRTAVVARRTKESDVRVELELDGTGQASSDTGVPFFDHPQRGGIAPAFEHVLPERFQHPVARLARTVAIDLDQRLIDKFSQRHQRGTRDVTSRLALETAAKHGEALKRAAFFRAQQPQRMVEHDAQAFVAVLDVAFGRRR